MIYTKLSSEIKQLEDNLNNTNTDFIILSGEIGSGKSLLLKQYQDYLWRKDQSVYTIFFRFLPTTGLIPQLLNLESQITSLVNNNGGGYRLLAESLRSRLSGDNLVTISGKPLSEIEIAELFKKSLMFVSTMFKKRRLFLLLDLSDIHDSRYDERMLGILRKTKIDGVKIILSTNQAFDEKKYKPQIVINVLILVTSY